MPWGAIIGGAAQIAGSLIGGRARRREQKAAQAQQAADLDQVRNFEFSNTFKGLENTAEDLTVNQQASNFQAQQTDQALAGGLDAIVASGGGVGCVWVLRQLLTQLWLPNRELALILLDKSNRIKP